MPSSRPRKSGKAVSTSDGGGSSGQSYPQAQQPRSANRSWHFLAVAAVVPAAWYLLPARSDRRDAAARDLLDLGRSDPSVQLRVFVRDFPGTGRGLAAARDFREGDVVIEVPLSGSASISGAVGAELARRSPETVAIDDDQRAKRDLVVSLLHERQKGPGTRWEPLFRALPLGISNVATMRDAQRSALRGTEAGAKFEEFDGIVAAAMESVRGAGIFSKTPTEEEVRWASAVIASRAHRFAGGRERVLWPYLVLINHHQDVNETLEYTVSSGPSKMFQLRARKEIRQGEEVFAHYGPYSNLRLVVQYGFAIPDNDFLEPTPMRLLKSAGVSLFKFMDTMPARGPQCQRLSTERLDTLIRRRSQPGCLPELLVLCWRIGIFQDVDSAVAALDVGFLDDGADSTLELPVAVFERDAEVLENIATACASERARLEGDGLGGDRLRALATSNDVLSSQLRDALVAEIDSWRACEAEMKQRAMRQRRRAARNDDA